MADSFSEYGPNGAIPTKVFYFHTNNPVMLDFCNVHTMCQSEELKRDLARVLG